MRCGGGVNHRLGLGDAVLIKDNHVAAAGSVAAALAGARRRARRIWRARWRSTRWTSSTRRSPLDAELVLLDNFTLEQTREAVRRRGRLRRRGWRPPAASRWPSPGPTRETGVDYLSVGALTHSVPALDLGLDLLG